MLGQFFTNNKKITYKNFFGNFKINFIVRLTEINHVYNCPVISNEAHLLLLIKL